MFYSNLNYVGRILTSEVNKHQIRLSLEEFHEFFHLPCTSSMFEVEGNSYSYIPFDISFLVDPNYGIPTPFKVSSIRLAMVSILHSNILILSFMNNVDFVKKGFDLIRNKMTLYDFS